MATHSKVIFARVTPEVHEMALRCSVIEDRSLSSLVRQALLLYFQHQGYFELAGDAEAVEEEGEQWPDWMMQQKT